jgi:2-iminobutanoate/2-iminopropanoate deaminase
MAGATVEEQTRQVLNNLEAVLEAAGLTFESVVKVEVFLKDLKDFSTVNAMYAEKFCYPIKPARATVEVSRLPMDALVEISCIATTKTD